MDTTTRAAVVGAAALGAAAAALYGSGRATVVTAMAAGAAIGATLSQVATARAAASDAPVRTFEDVARDDAAFKEAARAQTVDPTTEADALRRLFEGSSRPRLSEACTALNKGSQLEVADARWRTWAGEPREKLGAAIVAVIDSLDAPHLQPSGVEARLLGGLDPAVFGVFNLMAQDGMDCAKGTK
jgi:hypothetical protein